MHPGFLVQLAFKVRLTVSLFLGSRLLIYLLGDTAVGCSSPDPREFLAGLRSEHGGK